MSNSLHTVTSHAEVPRRASAGAASAYSRAPSDERLPLAPPMADAPASAPLIYAPVARTGSASSLLGAVWPNLTRSDSATKTAEALLESFALSRQSSDARSAAGRHSPLWDVRTRLPSATAVQWDMDLHVRTTPSSPDPDVWLSPDVRGTPAAALRPARGLSGPRPSVNPVELSEVSRGISPDTSSRTRSIVESEEGNEQECAAYSPSQRGERVTEPPVLASGIGSMMRWPRRSPRGLSLLPFETELSPHLSAADNDAASSLVSLSQLGTSFDSEHPTSAQGRRREKRTLDGGASVAQEAQPNKTKKHSALVSLAEGRGLAVAREPTALPPFEQTVAAPGTDAASDSLRTFPPYVHRIAGFDGWYRRVHVSSVLEKAAALQIFGGLEPGASHADVSAVAARGLASQRGERTDPAPHLFDAYTPRWTRGRGAKKEGLCPVCYEDGTTSWHKTKISAYNYHMQNYHGISAATGQPFDPPVAFRTEARPRAAVTEKQMMLTGKCHACGQFIDVEGPKLGTVKHPEIIWYKHAQKCHKGRPRIEGAGSPFVQDAYYRRVYHYYVQTQG